MTTDAICLVTSVELIGSYCVVHFQFSDSHKCQMSFNNFIGNFIVLEEESFRYQLEKVGLINRGAEVYRSSRSLFVVTKLGYIIFDRVKDLWYVNQTSIGKAGQPYISLSNLLEAESR